RKINEINVQDCHFEANRMQYKDAKSLIQQWFSKGITQISDICCKICNQENPRPKEDSPGSDYLVKISENQEYQSYIPKTRETTRFTIADPPPHLYIHLEAVAQLTPEQQEPYMNNTDWPAVFNFDGIEYHLISHGFWAYHHYWSEVVCTVKGICGIWKHDERENDGVACLVSPDPTKIGG
ncbi:hypothetical protein CROQUDRAFT_15632, partial [Cronartium quercuum f. sp. fusiforme G11]